MDSSTPSSSSSSTSKESNQESKKEKGCDVACSSKTVTCIENLQKEEMDDRQIAELLQAEFDLEYDEELKRLENARNKSN